MFDNSTNEAISQYDIEKLAKGCEEILTKALTDWAQYHRFDTYTYDAHWQKIIDRTNLKNTREVARRILERKFKELKIMDITLLKMAMDEAAISYLGLFIKKPKSIFRDPDGPTYDDNKLRELIENSRYK